MPLSQERNSLSRTGRRRAREAFTLVEVLVVIALIGVLTGLVLGISHYAQTKVVRTNVVTELERIKSLLEEYRLEYGEYPDTNSRQVEMTDPDFEVLDDYLTELGIETDEVDYLDAWGRPFLYERAKDSKFQYRLWSEGADESIPDDDITNWKGTQ